ncbi:GlxA family transcriptional regulator [Pseudochryseolinea flava]|uniref:AraC family transcriptional regulator n=1 Tax=Pseudochryseolinea flava TaxID=2059302 RepID=A0A364XUR2_9BACT|nr:helix-turn-helix domain-containing protein [Pseudochryseolinea flava]RAV97914.1 AraC family transcriptional regulator [Pseudochryseolinea flava]
MKHVTVIVSQWQTNLSAIVGIHEVFSKANHHWKSKGKREPLKVEFARVGSAKQVSFSDGLFMVKPERHISAIMKTDLIIIPSISPRFKTNDKDNKFLLQWINDQFENGAEVASICSGAFLLASTGLLDGKRCSTHWGLADEFKARFPKVNLERDRLITDESGIYTNGGAYSFLNLLIYLVEKFYDRATAIHCAKVLQVEIERMSQSPFSIFNGQKSHGDDVVEKAQNYIESKITEKISTADLATKFSLGRRNFDRRFIRATGNTPLAYTQRVKIEAAKRLFENSRKNINEVMYSVGYSDTKAFREVFRKITGMSPIDYRSKYNKAIASI